MAGKLIILSAPSGSGKSTIINKILEQGFPMKFSISATSRAPRGEEKHGIEYYFLTPQEFRQKIKDGDFLEYEEVYPDKFYGTLKSEVEKELNKGNDVVLDVDVAGGLNIKKIYGEQALLIFVMPPSVEELKRRLEARGTDKPEVIADRISKAAYEMSLAPKYDKIIINEDLEKAIKDTITTITNFVHL
ncbi:guanylate kinase [Dysgonomonadaceae bacterium PH5-43]|nr:guanylate kinase [Dysgonomonadaceae bacterium PH5-43]